jgi:hypothetical protein
MVDAFEDVATGDGARITCRLLFAGARQTFRQLGVVWRDEKPLLEFYDPDAAGPDPWGCYVGYAVVEDGRPNYRSGVGDGLTLTHTPLRRLSVEAVTRVDAFVATAVAIHAAVGAAGDFKPSLAPRSRLSPLATLERVCV